MKYRKQGQLQVRKVRSGYNRQTKPPNSQYSTEGHLEESMIWPHYACAEQIKLYAALGQFTAELFP
jgi:hypothetical protein